MNVLDPVILNRPALKGVSDQRRDAPRNDKDNDTSSSSSKPVHGSEQLANQDNDGNFDKKLG